MKPQWLQSNYLSLRSHTCVCVLQNNLEACVSKGINFYELNCIKMFLPKNVCVEHEINLFGSHFIITQMPYHAMSHHSPASVHY
jgi:hypothetical protein